MTDIERLNQQFGIKDHLLFKASGEQLIVAEINTPLACATVALQGAHVMQWQPCSQQQPVIWMSSQARLKQGKSLRGGIPICWPWFGAHGEQARFSAHGYARTAPWQVVSSELNSLGELNLILRLQSEAEHLSLWPHASRLELSITIAETLSLSLSTTNLTDHAVVVGAALHTYFQVSDIENVSLSGLEGVDYYDKVVDSPLLTQQGALTFNAETDQVYINSAQRCVIHDPQYQRNIIINKQGSDATVVWNPWIAKAERLGDLGEDGWKQMLCVESANALENTVTIAAGQTHCLTACYEVENIINE